MIHRHSVSFPIRLRLKPYLQWAIAALLWCSQLTYMKVRSGCCATRALHLPYRSGFQTKSALDRLLQRIALTTALLVLASCRPIDLMYATPEGPAEYQLGWQDGCDTGISAQGTYLNRAVYGFKKRPEMLENDLYKQGWNEGFTYCRYVTAADQQ